MLVYSGKSNTDDIYYNQLMDLIRGHFYETIDKYNLDSRFDLMISHIAPSKDTDWVDVVEVVELRSERIFRLNINYLLCDRINYGELNNYLLSMFKYELEVFLSSLERPSGN